MAMTPEVRVKTVIKKYLTSIGAYFFSPIGGAFSAHGVPDLVGCWRGLFFGIEVKAPGKLKNTTENQRAHLDAIRAADGISIVADDVKTVIDLFERLKLLTIVMGS